MSENVSAIANSPAMWMVTIFALVILIGQSTIFMKKSFEAGKHMGIPNTTLKGAWKAGALSAVGPALVIVSTFITLLVNVGAPTALMRLSYIGDVRYELQGATLAAKAYGTELTPANMTPEILFCSVAAMAIGCLGFFVLPNIFINQMDKIRLKLVGGREELLGVFTSAAVLGSIAYFNADYILSLDLRLVSAVTGFIIMTVLTIVSKKTNQSWIRTWVLTFAMFGGMTIAALAAKVM